MKAVRKNSLAHLAPAYGFILLRADAKIMAVWPKVKITVA